MKMEDKNSWNDQKESSGGVGRVGVPSLTEEMWKQGDSASAFSRT